MEAIFLVCGAGGPQLKRNPLGGRLHGIIQSAMVNDSASVPSFLFAPLFLAVWVVINLIYAWNSNWRMLARKYRAQETPDGATFRRQVYQIGRSSERGATTLVVSPQGLYLASRWVLRIGRPPLLIPWAAIGGLGAGRTWRRSWHSLHVDGATLIRVGEDAFAAMQGWLQAPRQPAA